MAKRRYTSITLALLCGIAVCHPARSDDDHPILRVGKPNKPCNNPQYSTIAAAIAAASPGDEIDICPALYPEQLIVSKPLTLRGVHANGVDRVLLQPALANIGGLSSAAVITVVNTTGVTIKNLAIDASNNTVSGCAAISNGVVITGSLAGIHFYNSSGSVESNAIFGAQLTTPSCSAGAGAPPVLFPGNGYGVEVDTDGVSAGPFQVAITNNSIHDFSRNGILAVGPAVSIDIEDNAISGVGPSSGSNQFGIFLALGASGRVAGNVISEGLCGAVAVSDCFNQRTEGIVLRAVGDGTVIDNNTITNAQSGIFLNGVNAAKITNNLIKSTDVLEGIHAQFVTNSLIRGNKIDQVIPLELENCGIGEVPGTSISGNTISNNVVNDAYCGVAFVTADTVISNTYFNTLYETLNTDLVLNPPPPTEP